MNYLVDLIRATGGVAMQVIDVASGLVVDEWVEANLVVTSGKTNIAKLLGGDTAGKAITQVAVGTDGTAPTVADTSLANEFKKAIASVSYPTATSVQFNFTIESSEANGTGTLPIQEFALYDVNNNMFARKVRAQINKTSAIRLVGTWIINIA
jgi:hypothetical protein